MLKRLLFIICLLLFVSVRVNAQVCLDKAKLQRIYSKLSDCDVQAKKLELTTAIAKGLEGTNANLQKMLDISEKKVDLWKAEADRQKALIKSVTAWYNNKFLWLTIGAIAGMGLTISVIHVTK